MRDKNGDIEEVETPEEFIEEFSSKMWEYNYISEETHNLLVSWLEDYIKLKQQIEDMKCKDYENENSRYKIVVNIEENNGVILDTPIGEIHIDYFKEHTCSLKNVIRIQNVDRNIVIHPSANNQILMSSWNFNEGKEKYNG